MIVRDTFARCDGCSSRVPVTDEEHPSEWIEVRQPDQPSRFFCSNSCAMQGLGQKFPHDTRILPFGLTDQQLRILELMALSRTNAEIAVEFKLAVPTVKNQVTYINRKLGTADRLQAVLMAHAIGIINMNKLVDQFADEVRCRTRPFRLRLAGHEYEEDGCQASIA